MARRPNYGFEKRQKELEREKKKDAKAQRKQARKDEAALDGETATEVEEGESPRSQLGSPDGPIA
jgi:hypothetical protein